MPPKKKHGRTIDRTPFHWMKKINFNKKKGPGPQSKYGKVESMTVSIPHRILRTLETISKELGDVSISRLISVFVVHGIVAEGRFSYLLKMTHKEPKPLIVNDLPFDWSVLDDDKPDGK